MSITPSSHDRQTGIPGSEAQYILPHNRSERPGMAIFNAMPRTILLALVYLLLLAASVAIKWSYHTIDAVRSFRDTASYAASADLPLTSAAFWAGERSFTVPLFFKLMGAGSQNYKVPAVVERISQAQSWFSILSWTLLGLAIALRLRNRWLGAAAFGLVLAFSLVYEISRWDLLLLSESLSCSLFALLLAGWIWLLGLPSSWQKSPRAFLLLVGVIAITVLYSFTRDSNPYFVIISAALFAAISLYRRSGLPRVFPLIYLATAILLFFVQSASFNTGNRWQVFIYDHLAYRILPDQDALAYFERAGLPVSEGLLKITGMRGVEYQSLLLDDPAFEAVRQWTNAHGKATYIEYLLAHPWLTLTQPLDHSAELLNGTAETVLYGAIVATDTYRVPLLQGQVIPRWLRGLTKVLFPILPVWAYAVVYLALAGLAGWALLRGWDPASWLVIAALLVTVYPLMALVWHGNPMEIGRHALQVAIAFRLAGWLALVFAVDRGLHLRKGKVQAPIA